MNKLIGLQVRQQRPMDTADIPSALREVIRLRESGDGCESATMTRLQEQQVKRGVARQEHYAGS